LKIADKEEMMKKLLPVVLILLMSFTVMAGCSSGGSSTGPIADSFEIRDVTYERYSDIYILVRGTIQNISDTHYDFVVVYARAFTVDGLILDTRYDYIGDLVPGEESVFKMYILDDNKPIVRWEVWVDTTTT
jgi:hypothetical protein